MVMKTKNVTPNMAETDETLKGARLVVYAMTDSAEPLAKAWQREVTVQGGTMEVRKDPPYTGEVARYFNNARFVVYAENDEAQPPAQDFQRRMQEQGGQVELRFRPAPEIYKLGAFSH